ncbi:hypothetical protein CKAH01_03751 [Colletotrichum kahawae]|uniref:NADAR domain-containing protein n=1 Tax=Colletotrichum kahawae TaxID=34407 RepID=A0AAD9YR32_COLKA|nr:hypothetical protein CKAH01_03751 [Colletotrichum kahawae]
MGPQAGKTNPKKASPSKKEQEDIPLLFYMPDAEWGEFFDEADHDGSITFNCSEQFMMYCKAARFHDTTRQAHILATPSPKEQKALGKATVGFADEMWDPIKSAVVEAGNIAKFSQNPHLAGKLLSTYDRLLCESGIPRPRLGHRIQC